MKVVRSKTDIYNRAAIVWIQTDNSNNARSKLQTKKTELLELSGINRTVINQAQKKFNQWRNGDKLVKHINQLN